jgi:hypothetical protein
MTWTCGWQIRLACGAVDVCLMYGDGVGPRGERTAQGIHYQWRVETAQAVWQHSVSDGSAVPYRQAVVDVPFSTSKVSSDDVFAYCL